MTVNNTKINGFTIDQFNQYDLTVGKKEGICPLCSTDRKPENRKAKCAIPTEVVIQSVDKLVD